MTPFAYLALDVDAARHKREFAAACLLVRVAQARRWEVARRDLLGEYPRFVFATTRAELLHDWMYTRQRSARADEFLHEQGMAALWQAMRDRGYSYNGGNGGAGHFLDASVNNR